ncbi:MAG: hypothetical protein AAF636_17855 [Pseudomonadota bacterium]
MNDLRPFDRDKPLKLTSELQVATSKSAAPDKNDKPAPFSLRLSREERDQLERAAAGMPLGQFIRQKLFEGDLTPRRTRGQRPLKDHSALGRVLGALGNSRLSNNLNQLAKAAHLGALPVTPDLEADLFEACETIRAMRRDLMIAIGFPTKEREP